MLDSFEKESKLNERRAARLVQMRLMEEAAAGTLPTLSSSLPPLGAYTSTASGGGIASGSGSGSTGNDGDYNFGSIMGTSTGGSLLSSTRMMNDIEMNAATVGTFVVDDDDDGDSNDDDDESPFSSSTPPPTPSDSNIASDHLWNKLSLSPGDSPVSSPTTATTPLNALAGENTTTNTTMPPPPPGSVWRNWKWTTTTTDEEKDSRNQESRELILLASRRLSQNGPILSRHQSPPTTTNTANNNTHNEGINLHGFHSQYNEDDEYELYHRQRGATRYIKLPSCCFTFHRHIIAGIMLLTLLILLLGVLEPHAHSDANAGSSGAQPPWAGIKHNHNKDNVGEGTITATITNPDKFSRIKDRLLERSISHASSLEDTSSPQYKALVWIVNEDVRQLDFPDVQDDDDEVLDKELVVGEEGEEEKDLRRRTLTTITGKEDEATILQFETEHALFQRYALATLYYQTTDVHIVRQSLTGQHVKDPFELPFNPLDLQKEDIQWRNNDNWLSGLGYCSWHGISCHSRGGGGEGSASALPENNDVDYYVSSLNLTSNNLNGIIPHEIYTAFPKLRVLDISKNELGGTIGREIGLLVQLQDLFMSENDFSGVIPNEIGKLSNLYNLYMNDNMFRGNIPTGMGNLMELRSLSMFNNSIEGTIPNSFGNLQNMIALYLDDNKLTGTIPKALGQMYSMIDLRLRRNELSGTIPTELGYLAELETLYLDSNPRINGTIPAELSKLAKLNELHLYLMNLSGPLPSELGLLDGLVFLYLDANELTGTIPEEWGELRDLEELFITGNNLSGRLPVTMRGMTSLRSLRAADNELSGHIPSDMGKMLKLEYVYLEGNDFSGRVPSELGQLTKLKLMHLHGNKFSGMAPEICKLSEDFVLIDLMADCTNMECTCCVCP